MSTWNPGPHHPIVELGDNLWTVEADLDRVPMRRRMCAIKLSTGQLVIHSAIALDDASMERLESWGTPAFVVVPNGYHRMDAPAYLERYPDIAVLAPAASRAKVEKVVRVDGDLDELPDDPALSVIGLEGGKVGEAALVVRDGDGASAIFCDAVFNVTEPTRGGFAGWVLKLIGSTGGPKVSWLARRAIVGDRARFADSLREVAAIPGLSRVVPGHGEVIDTDAAAVLGDIAAALSPPRS